MKKFKYIVALCAAAALLFSCAKEEEYVPGQADLANSYRVSFPEQTIVPSYEIDPADASANTVTVKATREVTGGRITVPLVIEQVPFDAPLVFEHTDLVFEDGASTAEFQISFPKAEVGVEYSCHIMIDDPQYAWMYSEADKPYVSFSFLKVQWETLATGSLDSWYAEDVIPGVTLQHCITFPDRYRFADPYGGGFNLVFTLFGDEQQDEQGRSFYNVRVAPFETPFTYLSYGKISFRDIGYWQGDDSYATWNEFYPDFNYASIYLQWYVSAGSLGYGPEVFMAD